MESQLSNEILQSLHTGLLSFTLPTAKQAIEILNRASSLTTKEPNLVQITGSVTVIGNISGQFHDYVEILKLAGSPSKSNHLVFLGDYCNRTPEGCEVVLSVALLKLLHNDNVTLLRGKLESDQISAIYGYKEESVKKLGDEFYKASISFFNTLPLAAVVNSSVFCVHGGIGPENTTLESITKLDRHQEIPHTGPITDLIWSDPSETDEEFGISPRGAGKLFGKKAVEAFLKANKLSIIVRTHQMVEPGYQYHFDQQVLNVYSAPLYCYQCSNDGAIVKFNEKNERNVITYKASEDTNTKYLAAMGYKQQPFLSTENLQSIHSNLLLNKLPTAQEGVSILNRAAAQFKNEATLLYINGPVTVIGNICGQWADYLEVLKLAGTPSNKNHFLFLGDLVNRGTEGTEVLLSVAVLKLLYGEFVHVLRGKLESDQISALYGYKEEVGKKLGNEFYTASVKLFNSLPLAAVVNNHIFCVHGGLGPDNTTIESIATLNKNQDVPHTGPITDLIWSDPSEQDDEFGENKRGAGRTFGKKAVLNFLKSTNMLCIIRSHQLVDDGFKYLYDEKVLTVFSAPNYCYQYANPGAIVQISERLEKKIITFKASEETVKRTEEAKKKGKQ